MPRPWSQLATHVLMFSSDSGPHLFSAFRYSIFRLPPLGLPRSSGFVVPLITVSYSWSVWYTRLGATHILLFVVSNTSELFRWILPDRSLPYLLSSPFYLSARHRPYGVLGNHTLTLSTSLRGAISRLCWAVPAQFYRVLGAESLNASLPR